MGAPLPETDIDVGTDSALAAFVDALYVDELVQAMLKFADGSEPLPDPRFVCHPAGVVVDTGVDGLLPVAVQVEDGRTTQVRLDFDPDSYEDASWVPAGLVACPSGTLVVGDPGVLSHFVHDPFSPPYESYGVWAVFSMPGPGWLSVHVLKQGGLVDNPNLALRATWVATSAT